MTETTEKAILAGDCFWNAGPAAQAADVISTRVGYTGGDGSNATYRHHGTHAEVIDIVFDLQQISHGRVYWLARRRSSRSSASVILAA
jgi:peptide-methionine (S)-S-oxide reductase